MSVDNEFHYLLRTRAVFRIFTVAIAASNEHSLQDLRVKLIEALEAVDEALKCLTR